MVGRKSAEAISPVGRGLRDLVVGFVFAGFLLGPLASGAAEQAVEEEADQRNGFAGFVEAAPHVVVQKAKGSVDTNFGIQSGKSNILTSITFRLGGGLKGPAIDSIMGRPRPVVWAAALIPINESATIGARFIETSVPGSERLEYSKFSIEYSTSALAGLGLEFRVPVFDSEITITPAIESLHLVTRYVGKVSLQVNQGLTSVTHKLREKKEMTQHFLGPAVRVGTPTIVVRGVAIDFFLDVSLLLDVAGTHRIFGASNQASDSADFSFESGSGVAQVGSGFQIRWP